MYIQKFLSLILLVSIGVGLIACGAGFEVPPLRPQGNLSGTIGDEAGQGATIRVFAVQNGGKGELLGETIVADDGSYALDIRAKTQPILIELSAGVYRESASGKSVSLAEGMNLRAMAVYTSGDPLTITISPVTHIATALALFENSEGKDLAVAVTESHALLDQVFNFDVYKTHPLPIGKILDTPDELKSETIYGFYLAAISSWTAWVSKEHELEPHSVYNTPGLSQILYDDVLADGLLNGRGVNSENGQARDLFYGKIRLDANVYRISFAQHMLAIAGSAENKTTIGAKQLLDVAHELATSQHPIYGDRELGEFAEQAPVVYALESENSYQNGTFHFTVALGSVVGAETVEFFVDDLSVGMADDLRKPFADIDTRLYEDGDHKIVVVTTNVFEKSNKASFTYRFDNTKPIVKVLSPLVTNQRNYTLSGTCNDSGVGVKSLSVYGVGVDVAEDGSWATEFVLERGKNSIPIVVTDMLGNPSEQSISVGLDQVSPLIDTVDKHGKGQFVNGGETVERVLADQNDDEALQIETSRIDLGSVGINRQSLDENKVPYFAFSVSDPDEDDVFSSFDDIAVSYQYKINDKIISDWNPFSPVENEYLVPLASQGLHTAWYKANLLDEHIVNIEVKDKAGNISDKKFSFRADFRLPETGILDENIVEDKDSADMFAQYDFSKRSELNGRTFSAVRYKYTNDTGHAIYIKPEDDEQHKLVRSYDEAVRVNKVKWTLMTEWRLNRILNVFNPTECPVASDMEPVVVTTLANYVGGGWKLETVPEEERSAPAKVASDNPIDFDTNWTGFHFDDEFSPAAVRDIPTFGDKPLSISYQYDYLVDINLLDEPSLVGGWQLREHNVEDNTSVVIKTCENVSYLEGRVRFSSPISEPGYPKSEMLPTPDPENTPFTTSGFIVNNIEEGDIAPVDGWYRIPAGHSVWIHKLVDTPDLENYTSNEVVDNLESIRSYDPLRYDKEISWQVKQQLKISAIHDAGAENVNKMSARVFSVRENEEDVSMFTISR